ncbi:hypothetical protein GCM10010406_51310 [Streptomyces thermolineatus]|uniref:Transposase n=1 Tax=Streptomyces thermolineatus TaxID=44033 RepID=A0ABN3MTJ8_9ACTN
MPLARRAEPGRTGFMIPACGFPPMCPAADEALFFSGVVEEHANRIKMLKRQMLGRAGFQLLRKRVLLAG